MRRGAASNLSKKVKDVFHFNSDNDFTSEVLAIDSFFSYLDQQIHLCIIGTRGQGCRACCVLSKQVARWLLQLNEFVILVVTLRGLGIQALLDLIAQFISEECEHLHEDLSCEEICSVETKEWCFAFDGSEVVGKELSYMIRMGPVFFCLSSPILCSNETNYETLVIGLISALRMGTRRLQV